MGALPALGRATLRAFIAIETDPGMRERILAAVESLRPALPGVRWVRPEGIHLTLRFLGSVAAETLARMEPALQEAAAECPPFEARATGLGLFPMRGSPRVLWLGLDLPAPVLRLQQRCEAVAIAAGFPAETRAFRPHLTLGRWRERAPRPSLPAIDLRASRCERLALFHSELRPGGAVYTRLAEYPLAGTASLFD